MTLKSPVWATPALIAAVASLVLFPAASAANTGLTIGWASTTTQAEPLPGAEVLGAASASMPMHIAVALNLQNKGGLEQLVASEQTITPDEFATNYAPRTLRPARWPATSRARACRT